MNGSETWGVPAGRQNVLPEILVFLGPPGRVKVYGFVGKPVGLSADDEHPVMFEVGCHRPERVAKLLVLAGPLQGVDDVHGYTPGPSSSLSSSFSGTR